MRIPYGLHYIDNKDVENVAKALKNTSITQGPLVNNFEKQIAKFLKVKYAVAVSSCSAGLHIALKAINYHNNKTKVLTSPISFVSTANAILHNNLKPKFVDINRDTLNIDFESLKNQISKNKKIKAIIPVHLGGFAGESKNLYKLCKKNKIFVIEDAAHSFGAKYDKHNMVGSCKYSDISVFSFHPVKTITTGEGGVITTNSKNIYKNLLKLRSHGIEKNFKNWKNKNLGFTKKKPNLWYYEMQEMGLNYRITDFQCALGLSQLKKIKNILNYRKKVAEFYDKEFKNCKNLFLPQYKNRQTSSNHLYVLNINFKKIKITRNDFMKKLLKYNIITQVHYIPITLHPFYKKFKNKKDNLKNALKYYQEALSIPIYFNLKTTSQKLVIKKIKQILKDK